ncbi:pre-mRNA cleavage complex 2 Pcf11-like isoform X1 [Brachionus plicatilis]|uniref:Pre-mRNA cleavage complex 2 Pcf11-like isoform X1 n=1 Tax=Brachionus plicatilis TaxID=10195 RepID=A0A3M7PNM8_BRAPC|nr:pre-mRNA cleavage complex 2 Pcf11-like isoform X1 [Brachionus plicatilis]
MTTIHEEDYTHFKATLFADLTQNLKPVIISLTMLAEDYCRSDTYIARAIEEYIDEVPPDIKILGLYLIDSIMKNFKTNTSYIKIFERNIVSLFERVFKSVDENNRKALYKLRQTWLDLFTVQTLYDLDVRIKKIDPAWPITAVIPTYVPTVVKPPPPPIREIAAPPQPVQKKPEPKSVVTKKPLFDKDLESIGAKVALKTQPVKKNPVLTITNKSPVKPNANSKPKIVQKNNNLGKSEKSPEVKAMTKQAPKTNSIKASDMQEKKIPIIQNTTNQVTKKMKLSPTSNDKVQPKKIIPKSASLEAKEKKEKPAEPTPIVAKSVSTSNLKHAISDRNDKKPDNIKRMRFSHNSAESAKPSEKECKMDEGTQDVDLRFLPQIATKTPAVEPVPKPSAEPSKLIPNIDMNLVKSILQNAKALESTKVNQPVLNNRTNKDQEIKEPQADKKEVAPEPVRVASPAPVAAQPVPQLKNLAINDHKEEEEEEEEDKYDLKDLPPIKFKDYLNENSNDSLLIIDGRSYRIQPDVKRTIKVYYHDHEVYCDTRNKDIKVDQQRVAKMGDNTKEIMLNGRRVRLMYMGKRIELWLDGISYQFRADSPPKQIVLVSSMNNQAKKYYVTIDSRTLDMYFNNFKVCTINGGLYGDGPSILRARLAPDDSEQHEISFVCPPKRIMIDGIPRKMRYDLPVPCIEMDNGQFHIIRFTGPPKDIFIDNQAYLVPFDKTIRIKLNGRAHELAWGGPGFEVIVDGRPYELQFNKPEREINIGNRSHLVCIYGEAPDVKICGRLPKELCEKAQQIELKPITVKPPPLMTQPVPTPTDPSILNAVKSIAKPQAPNVHDLFNKLKDHNLLGSLGKSDKREEDMKVPDLTSFDADLLKQKYSAAFKSLYSGDQCSECGNRFNKNAVSNGSTSSRYAKHLDWHYRQNKKEKEEINKAHSRSWYYTLKDWVLFEEISEEQVVSNDGNVNEGESAGEGSQVMTDEPFKRSIFDNNGIRTCPATDDIEDFCAICKDPFEIFWYAEKEEWHFKDAIRDDNKIYHPICYEDNKEENEGNQSQELNVTPVKMEPI